MKRIFGLVLAMLMLLVPVYAFELDVVESTADEAVATLSALPGADTNYGDLIYYSDFDEYTNYVNKEVVGENASGKFELAYVAMGNWGSNLAIDPTDASSTNQVQEIIVADHTYNWASGINVTVKSATLKTAQVTMVYDVYFPNPVEEYFKMQIKDGFKLAPDADYDAETGGWQTIVMPVNGAYSGSGDLGFNFVCNDTNKTGGTGGATAGLTYYVDNVKIYAKPYPADYASKPAMYDVNKGILVYFNNGNAADAYSNTNGFALGSDNTHVADGYYVQNIGDRTAVKNEATLGIGFSTSADDVVFTYADGTDMNGNINLYIDMYNAATSNMRFMDYRRAPSLDSSKYWCGGFTNWGNHTAAASTWTTLNRSFNADSSFIGFARNANNGADVLFWRSMAAYYMPATRVTVDGVIVDLNGKTEYTLPAFDTTEFNSYKDADGNVFVPGTYAVADINGKVFTSYLNPVYATKPAETTADGTLVFFYNGNAADTVNTLGADIIGEGSKGVYDGYHVTYTTDCTALIGSCSSHGIAVAPASGDYAKNGRITLVVEQYNNMTNKANVEYTALASVKLGAYKSAWASYFVDYDNTIKTYPGNWYTLKATAVTENKAVGFFERAWINHANLTRGFKSISVYLDPYKVTIDGDVVNLEDYKEYTLPTGTGFNYYKDENGAYYAAGTAVASATLDGKTLTAVQIDYATKPADFSHGRGILVYFDNGNEADFYSNMNATLVGYKNTTDVDGYFTRDLSSPASAGISGTVGIGLDTGDSATKFAYADGTDMNGALYIAVDMYNDSDSSNRFYRGVRTNGWDGWCGVYTDWRGYNAAARTWSNVAEAFDSELSFAGFADTDNGNWQASTFRSVYAYYMPYARVALDVSGTPEIIDLTGKTEYTFPEITDGVNNVWRDSEGVYYFPGDVAAVEDINTKTYFASNFNGYAPATETAVEIKLTSNTAKNGVRFKAALAPSKKVLLDEAGFIAGRQDVINALGGELTFDLTAEGVENAEGTLYASGVAYNAVDGTDIISEIADNGDEIFACVCVGIDINNKAQVNTVLVARPYVKFTLDGKQITVYGDANTASLAETVIALKNAADNGDEAAAEAYNSNKEYVDLVINTAK